MDDSASLRVEDDQGTCPNSPTSVEGGQAFHAPPMNEPEQVAGGTMGILQQLAQALQSVTPRFPVRSDWRIRTEFEVRDHILGLFT